MSVLKQNTKQYGQSPDELNDLSVLALPPHLKKQYETIVIVDSHQRALEVPEDKDQLIVTSDWLSWRRLTDQGAHCLHFEAMLGQWTEERGLQENLVMDANAWHFDGSTDISLFHGVSLGNGFSRHMTYMYNAYHRLRAAINAILKLYGPKRVIYHGIRMESDILDFTMIETLLSDLTKAHSCALVIKTGKNVQQQPTYPVGQFLKTHPQLIPAPDPIIRSLLRHAYLLLVKILFTLRFSPGPSKPRVYLFLNWLGIQKLVDSFDLNELTPVLLAELWPKSFSFLMSCLRKGVYLTTLPSAKLSPLDIDKIESIISSIKASWAKQTTGFQFAQKHFVRQYFLGNRLIFERALNVKKYNMLLKKMKIGRVVVGDSENWICSMVIEIACTNNVPTDELLNGMFLSSLRTPNRNSRWQRKTPPLGRLLSWGQVNEKWLASMSSPLQSVRTGYPTVESDNLDVPLTTPQRNNALLLPVIPSGDDPAALYSQTFSHLVSAARVLKSNGYKNLRIKIHPGHVSIKPYYEEILSYFELACDVVCNGPLSAHTDWADLIIGPINSGSYVEVLAQGKPYYPCQIFPSSLNQNLFREVRCFGSMESLKYALRDEYLPDRMKILEYFCSSQSIPNAAHRFWQVMAEAVVKENRKSFV